MTIKHCVRRLVLPLALLVCCLLALPARAETQTVRVGYVLFENYQEGGEGEYKRGFGYEYLQRLAYATGWEYEYVYGSFSELLAMLQSGDIDLMGDLSYTAERAKPIRFSALPQGQERYYIYTTDGQEGVDPDDAESLNGRRIGVTSNSYQYRLLLDWLAENEYRCTLVEYPGTAALVAGLHVGEVDAVVMTDMASSTGLVPVANIGYSDFYYCVSRSRPDLLAELNRAMREIQTIDPYFNVVTYAKYNTSALSNSHLSKAERQWLEEHEHTVRLGYLENDLPYCATAADGTLRGVITALVDAFETDFDIRVQAVPFAVYDDMAQAAANGEIDLFGPLYLDYWLAEQYDIFDTKSILTTTCVLLYQGEYADSLTNRIAYFPGNAVQRGAAEVLYPNAEFVACDSKEDMLEAVLDGRADCTILSSAMLNLIRQYKAMRSLNLLELPGSAEVCLGTARGNSALLNIANRVIFAASEDLNGVALMENTYAEAPVTLEEILQQHAVGVTAVLVGIIVLMLVCFLWYMNMQARLAAARSKNEALTRQAYRDSLTKTGNRAGYLVLEKELQMQMVLGRWPEFSLVVADVNGLKEINDTLGHEEGDMLIRNTSALLRGVFANSQVFRIGGDEFVVVLTGEDHRERAMLLERLRAQSLPCVDREAVEAGRTSVACGMAAYDRETDRTVAAVFDRADREMYRCKTRMKGQSQRP